MDSFNTNYGRKGVFPIYLEKPLFNKLYRVLPFVLLTNADRLDIVSPHPIFHVIYAGSLLVYRY